MELTHEQVFDIFSWGVDYGQFTMEEERSSEEFADAFQGFIIAQKYSMPSYPAQTRQLHSDKWFEVKKTGFKKFKDFMIKNYGGM